MGVNSNLKLFDLNEHATAKNHLMQSGKFYVIFPGASIVGRQWPPDYFVEISFRIFKKFGWHGYILGGDSDISKALSIKKLVGENITNLAGKTNIHELLAIIAKASLLVTNETSAAHIGASQYVPTVCITGGGHFGRFLPYEDLESPPPFKVVNFYMDCYGCNWLCKYSNLNKTTAPCIKNISVDFVWARILSLIVE